MGTAEIIIVFSALMALIALVAIGIDWIGKPLKNRRFIPRMYRFEDEKLPMDAYGHTDFTVSDQLGGRATMPPPMMAPSMPAAMMPMHQPAPTVVARVGDPRADASADQHYGSPDTVAVPVTAPAARDAEPDETTTSAFSDSLSTDSRSVSPTNVDATTSDIDDWLATGLVPAGSLLTGDRDGDRVSKTRSGIASTVSVPSMGAWEPGVALDATINDRKPNLATKAQRFWMATAHSLGDSHFDDDDLARMRAGKAPRRLNPRTGRTETMQLTGLRQASQPAEARMRWLEDAIDPWNTM